MGRPGFTRHPKFRRLVHVLNREHPGLGELIARGALEAVWEAAYENGDAFIGDALSVEAVANWNGTPGVLCAALVEAGGPGGVGFIEPSPDREGCFAVHDLWDHAPEYVQKRRARELERQTKGAALRGDAGQRRSVSAERQSASGQCLPKSPTPAPAPAPAPAQEKLSAASPPSSPDGEKPKRARKEPAGPAAECFRHWREVVWPKLSSEPYPTDHGGDHSQLAAKVKTYGPERVKAAMDRCEADPYWRDKIRTIRRFCGEFANFLERATGPPAGLAPAKKFKGFENDKEIWE